MLTAEPTIDFIHTTGKRRKQKSFTACMKKSHKMLCGFFKGSGQ